MPDVKNGPGWNKVLAPSFFLLGLGFLAWGLKLETELNTERNANVAQNKKIARLETDLDRIKEAGILPRAEERIKDLERRIECED